jgi:hypothetical protein
MSLLSSMANPRVTQPHSPWPVRDTGWNWTAGLVTAGCLVEQLRLWQPWHTFSTSLNWTDVTSYSHFVTIIVSQFRYFAGLQQPRPLAWSTHLTPTLTPTIKCWIGRNKFSLQHNTVDWNSVWSLRSETQSLALNGALQKKRMADVDLFIVALHHVIAE